MRISDWSSDVCSSDLHYDQFYGQLSLERLNRAQPKPTPDPTIEVSGAERRAFEDDRLVRAARALGEIGAWREQSAFLRALAQQASSPADHILAGQLAQQNGRPERKRVVEGKGVYVRVDLGGRGSIKK